MLATSDFRDGNAVIGKVLRYLTPETSVNGYGKLVLHPLRMSSQCSSSWSSRDRPRSYLPVPEIRRAAAFNTRCSSSVIVFGDEARTELQ